MGTRFLVCAVPAAIDTALRHRAELEAKSVTTVAVEAMVRGLDLTTGFQESAAAEVEENVEDVEGLYRDLERPDWELSPLGMALRRAKIW
jgi:hypothetical protein